jgi:SAM-dependent methyltransferase
MSTGPVETHRTCPVCHDHSGHTVHVVNGYDLKSCPNCTMVFADIDEVASSAGNTFDEDYFFHYLQFEPLSTTAFYDSLATAIKRLHPLSANKQLRLLDFGCGAGEFVDRAVRAEIDAEGLDCSPYATLARDLRHLRIHVEELADNTMRDGSFDVVFSHAVFEHLHEPLYIGRQLLAKLRPDGLFVISGVPNYNSIERRVLGSFDNNAPPGHINFFTPRSLDQLCRHLGLLNPIVRTYGIPIWYFLNALRRHPAGVTSERAGVQAFKVVRGFIPEKREPTWLHRAMALFYQTARIPTMGVALVAYGRKS